MVLPAVKWRGRRCAGGNANHLRQLGLAVHQYHDVCQVLPVSVGPWLQGPRPTPQRNGKGWIVSVLPQMEQQPLYDRFAPFFDGDFLTGYGIKSLGCRAP